LPKLAVPNTFAKFAWSRSWQSNFFTLTPAITCFAIPALKTTSPLSLTGATPPSPALIQVANLSLLTH